MMIYSAKYSLHVTNISAKSIRKSVKNYIDSLNPLSDEYKAYECIVNAVADNSNRALSKAEINSKALKRIHNNARINLINNFQKLGYEIEVTECIESFHISINWKNPT